MFFLTVRKNIYNVLFTWENIFFCKQYTAFVNKATQIGNR